MINELFSGFKKSLLGKFSINLMKLMPNKVFLALFLMLFNSLIQGISLILLIPLLGLVGLNVDQGSIGQVSVYVIYFFNTLGVQLNLFNVLTLYVLAISFSALLNRYQILLTSEIQFKFSASLRKQLYTTITTSNWLLISRMKSSNFVHALTNEIERISFGTGQFLSFISSVMILIVYVIFAIKLAGILTGVVFIAGVVILLFLRRMVSRSRSYGEDVSETTQNLYSSILQQIDGLKTIKSFNMQEASIQQFSIQTNEVTKNYMSSVKSYADVKAIFDIGTVIILAVMVLILLELIKLPIAILFLLIYIFVMMIPQFSIVQRSYQYFINMLPAYESVTTILNKCKTDIEVDPNDSKSLKFNKFIKFKDIYFRYDSNDKFVLQSFNMKLLAGKTTALVGSSGAGKSTVADMLMGLIKPEYGEIRIDDNLFSNLNNIWGNKIGYVSQETFLFNETIRFNLLLAKPNATDQEIDLALKASSAHNFVFKLPKGLDTIIGDRGVRLSGGERQRLSLARALIRQPMLLILDEATSNLDTENEQRILKAIDDLHGDTAILIIAHRMSTIKNADYVYVMNNGRVINKGNWCEIFEN